MKNQSIIIYLDSLSELDIFKNIIKLTQIFICIFLIRLDSWIQQYRLQYKSRKLAKTQKIHIQRH